MGGPLQPKEALVGGIPTATVDIPICAVFIALFLGGAIAHTALFWCNIWNRHRFTALATTVGFCISRIAAHSTRIAWACHPENVRLAIATEVLVEAGVVFLFILNLIYSHWMLRSVHPRVGWSFEVSGFYIVIYVIMIFTIVMAITVTAQSAYTLNINTNRIDLDIQRYVTTCFAVITFLPLILVGAIVLSSIKDPQIEKFGTASWYTKAGIFSLVAALLCLGASFRAATVWFPPRLASDPAWYHDKACYYVFNFVIEIIVVYIYLFVRMDLHVHVPNGSWKVQFTRGKNEDFNLKEEHVPQPKDNQEPHDDQKEAKHEIEDANVDIESGGISLSEVPITSPKHHPNETVDSLSTQDPDHNTEYMADIRF